MVEKYYKFNFLFAFYNLNFMINNPLNQILLNLK